MKRFFKLGFFLCMLTFLVALLFACSNKLTGSYQSEEVFGTSTVYEFSGNDVSRTIKSSLGSKTVKGEYEIREKEDGGLSIILDFDEDDNEVTSWDFVKEKDYIEIAGIRYNKVDKK